MHVAHTFCCAMDHLCDVRNDTSRDAIKEKLETTFAQGRYAPTLILCVTSPGEDKLGETLQSLGFKRFADFPQRGTYLELMPPEKRESAPPCTLWGVKKGEVIS